jgi:hypothetical protein
MVVQEREEGVRRVVGLRQQIRFVPVGELILLSMIHLELYQVV